MRLKLALSLLKADLMRYRISGFKKNIRQVIHVYYHERGFRFIVWLRLASANGLIGFMAKLILHHLQSKFNMVIHSCTSIGGGFYLGHGVGVVIHPGTIIGNNVSISHFVSIGTTNQKAAVIGDDVYIGPNVSVVGNVVIGEGAIIGAGAVVTSDIPAYAVAVGVPARTIKYRDH